MLFSKTELNVLAQVGIGNKQVSEIAKALKISDSQVYRLAQKLSEKGMIILSKAILQPTMKTHVNLLLQIIAEFPNLSKPFSGTGLKIYTTIIEPKTIDNIEKETGLHKTTIFKKLNQGLRMSLVFPKDHRYKVNDEIWPKAKEFLIELKKYEESIDPRVPVNSIIYYKNDKEIIFSSKEEIDAVKTAFSAYEKYGIKILTVTYYYYLPKRKLTKEDVFIHSLHVTEKDQEIRHLIFIALFYLKFKKELSRIKHPIIEKIERLLIGEKIDMFPSLAEIKDRADVYGIKV